MIPPFPCPVCHAPRLPGRPCPLGCRSEAARAKIIKTRTRYSKAYRVARARLLAGDPDCHWRTPGVCTVRATEADHDGDRLVPACQPCNNHRAQTAAAAARKFTYVGGL